MVAFENYLRKRIEIEGAAVVDIVEESTIDPAVIRKWIGKYRLYSAKLEARVYFLRHDGYSLRAISRITGLQCKLVRKFVSRYEHKHERAHRASAPEPAAQTAHTAPAAPAAPALPAVSRDQKAA